MKRKIFLVLAVCVILLFCACSAPEPLTTKLGDFRYKQEFTPSIGEASAAQGNIYLVIYLTPQEGNDVTEDEAHEYFYSGTKAQVDEEIYDMYCLAFEKVDSQFVRFGLVFEVTDNGYADAKEQPPVSLILP